MAFQFDLVARIDLETVLAWFQSEAELRSWGGPQLQFPMDLNNLDTDLDLAHWSSYAMKHAGTLVGFGQYCDRFSRCHLGRLAIAPSARGRGLIADLIRFLAQTGCAELGYLDVSLYVLENNDQAVRAYRKLGFQERPFPELPGLANCLYMISRLQALGSENVLGNGPSCS